jgi:hypothetical protein
VFSKIYRKIQISLKSGKNNGYFTWRFTYNYDISPKSSYNEKCFRKNLQRKSKHIFSRKSCRLRDNVEKYGRVWHATDYNIIRCMRFACWVTKSTDTVSEYVIFIAFPRQQQLRESDPISTRALPVLLKIIKVTFKLHICRVYIAQTGSNESHLTISSVEHKDQI